MKNVSISLTSRIRLFIAAIMVVFAPFLSMPIASAASEYEYNEFLVPPLPSEVNSYPNHIAAGSDGALWFTQYGAANAIGRMTTTGVLTEYTVPTPNSSPHGITAGPDGALWFVENGAGKVGRITTSGVFTEYVIPTANSNPENITAGPDGALWFTEYGARKIGRITSDGVITEFSVPNANNGNNPEIFGITAGSDGALWYTQLSAGARSIGRMTTSGTVTRYPLAGSHNASMITTGPDGALWFTMSGFSPSGKENPVGRMTTSGAFMEYQPQTSITQASNITTGTDGKLYFTALGTVSSITTSGEITSYSIPAEVPPNNTKYFPGITTGSDGAIWITSTNGNRIGRFELNQPPNIAQLTNITIAEGSTYVQSGSFTDTQSTSWTASVDYGDGTGPHPLELLNTGFTLSHVYKDEGTYSVTVSVTDNQGATSTNTATVIVTNEPASVDAIIVNPLSSVEVGNTITAAANFADPGVLDTHTSTWDWGDGITSTGVISEDNGAGSVTGTHAYGSAGTFTVTLTITDNGNLSNTRIFEVITVAPVAPLDLTATTPTNGDPVLNWTMNGPTDQFNIYRNGLLIGTSAGLTYTDTTAQEGTMGYYVKAVKQGIESDSSNTVSVTIDRTGPTVIATPDSEANANGWYNTNVLVSFNCSDPQTGMRNCATPITLDAEGTNQAVTGCGTDNAGNITCSTVNLNVDMTVPTITASVSAAPNPQGWDNSPVMITFNCSDALSGVASCTSPVTVSAEGLNQEIVGTVIDNAGNVSTTTAIVSIDNTKPTIVATQTPAANANGWNNTDVTVTYTCTDNLSGITSCSSPTTLSTQGNNLSATGTAVDNAGNSNSVTISPIKIDKTAPTATGATMSNTFILFTSNVTLSANVSDNLAGVVGGEYYIDTDPGQGNGIAMAYGNGKVNGTTTINNLSVGSHKLYIRSKDAAGNWSATTSVTFTYI